VRVCTAFNRILQLPAASVCSVEFTDQGLVLGLRRSRRRKLVCPCGAKTWARYDASRRRWRHVNFGATRVFVEADVFRIDCRSCGRVRTEQVPWARAGARHTRDFEDIVGWLAQRADKTTVSRLMGCSWEAVDHIAHRLVEEHLDDSRLDNLYRIGVDEISYKRGHYYLTVVADHDGGNVVWVGTSRSQAAFEEFFDILGEQRSKALQAITLDAAPAYTRAARDRAPQAQLCLDPFHVIKWCNETLDQFYKAQPAPLPEYNGKGQFSPKAWRRTRLALRSAAEKLDPNQQALINSVRRHNYRLFRAWELKEQLRELYRSVDPDDAPRYLKRWCTSAIRSKIPAFATLGRRIRRHLDPIIAAVQLGLANSRLEGINSKIRVIQRRGYGHPSPRSLTAMIYLCLGGIKLTLPTQR
jgi:transposase